MLFDDLGDDLEDEREDESEDDRGDESESGEDLFGGDFAAPGSYAQNFEHEDLDAHKLCESRANRHLIGHTELEQQLLQMIEIGRLPHGLIFSGPSGVGKSVMAYRLARFLLAGLGDTSSPEPTMFGDLLPPAPRPKNLEVAQSHAVFAQVASGGHPDLLSITRLKDEATGGLKASLQVDEIRKIAPFFRRTAANEGGWRIVIIDDADTMTRSSQNSLLKILEEPPEKSLIILITHRAGALLPTIYSRVHHMIFSPLGDEDIKSALRHKIDSTILPPALLPNVLNIAEGSLGRALQFADAEKIEILQTILNIFSLFPHWQWSDILNMAELWGSKSHNESLQLFKDIILYFVRAAIRRSALQGPEDHEAFNPTGQTAHHHEPDFVWRLAQSFPLNQLLNLYDELQDHFLRCQVGNLDKKFIILGAFTVFEKIL